MELVPADLPVVTALGRVAAARTWLAELPSLVERVRDEFGLRLSAPLHGGSCSWVAPAVLPDGRPVIVKIGWPHREMRTEPAALRLWDGRGAVRLIARAERWHALLLERCDPGTPLSTSPGTAAQRLRAGCAVLRLLWTAVPPAGPGASGDRAAGEIERLGPVTGEWADLVEERTARLAPGYDPGLVAEGARLLRGLPGSARREVVLHGDFNPGNILSHDRAGERRGEDAFPGGWLAIDPKPMIGDPAYDPWPLIEQVDDPFAAPRPARVLRERVGLVADELSLDAERIVLWAVARRVETALWLAEHGDVAGGAAVLGEARILADLAVTPA